MGEFFHGWRRKAGSVTLLMALALMMGWIRSYAIGDEISFCSNGKRAYVEALSFNGRLGWWHHQIDIGFTDYEGNGFHWATFPLSQISSRDVDRHLNWQLTEFGFGYGAYSPFEGMRNTCCVISYWAITMPLTLLSAYLILWPGKRVKPHAQTAIGHPLSI